MCNSLLPACMHTILILGKKCAYSMFYYCTTREMYRNCERIFLPEYIEQEKYHGMPMFSNIPSKFLRACYNDTN